MSGDELFIDGSYSTQKMTGKCRENQWWKRYKVDLVAEGKGIPFACSTRWAEGAEVNFEAEVVYQANDPEVPTPLIVNKGYDNA